MVFNRCVHLCDSIWGGANILISIEDIMILLKGNEEPAEMTSCAWLEHRVTTGSTHPNGASAFACFLLRKLRAREP